MQHGDLLEGLDAVFLEPVHAVHDDGNTQRRRGHARDDFEQLVRVDGNSVRELGDTLKGFGCEIFGPASGDSVLA